VSDFEHGVWLVDLSALRDPELVLGAIAGVLGARTSVEEHISNRELVLVLDNFEQVVDAAPDLGSLLESCPLLRLVVTSREPLRISGEREYALRPLAEAPAVELFRQRVSTDASYQELAALCDRLDNLPLAIELAAARAKALPFDELARRLERRLPTLEKGRRDAPERQRTLRATIDWSYELLTAEEQLGFAGLAVFRGGSSLGAAEQVADVDADLLDSLVDKSLVRREGERYSMLETIREYAAERLDERDDADDLRRRHAEWIVALGHSANMNIESEGEQRHDAVNAEVENVRAALDWARARGETELEIRILFALENWWTTAGPTRQSLERAEALLGRLDGVPHRLQAELLRVLGNASFVLGVPGGLHRYEEALAHYRQAGDEAGTASMLVRIAVNVRRDDVDRARSLVDEALVVLERIELPRLALQAVMVEGLLAFDAGDVERGIALFAEVASSAERIGFVWQQEQAFEGVAEQLHRLGRFDEAEGPAREALVLARRMGDWEDVAYLLALLASCAARTGDTERAGRLWRAVESRHRREPLEVWRGVADRFGPDLRDVDSFGAPLDLEEAVAYALDLD
jgi:predicted ATPase